MGGGIKGSKQKHNILPGYKEHKNVKLPDLRKFDTFHYIIGNTMKTKRLSNICCSEA